MSYAPVNYAEKNTFYNSLSSWIEQNREPHSKLIVCGVFNVTNFSGRIIRKKSLEKVLHDFLKKFKLIDVYISVLDEIAYQDDIKKLIKNEIDKGIMNNQSNKLVWNLIKVKIWELTQSYCMTRSHRKKNRILVLEDKLKDIHILLQKNDLADLKEKKYYRGRNN